MKPFVLRQHDQDFAALRVLRAEEMAEVYGGIAAAEQCPGDKSATSTVTPNGDGGDDGCDQG